MSGLSVRAIQLRLTRGFKGANIVNVKTAGVQTVRGLQSTNIIPADIVFDWLLDDNLELAKAMGKAGATLYMHQIVGFKLPATEKPEPEYLPTTYEKVLAVNNLATSLQFFGIEISNPRFRQASKDLVCDLLGLNQNALTPTSEERWVGCVERAEQLGYPVNLISKYRCILGKFVKASGLDYKEEKRLCNGTERDIKLYKLTAQLDNVIKEYMDAKVLAN